MIKNVYDPADEVFRYIFDSKHSLVTDVEQHLRKVFPDDTINIRPIINELEGHGIVYREDGWNYVSMKPKGNEMATKHGLYSLWLKSIEEEKKLSSTLILEQIKDFEKNNWYKRREFAIAVLALLISLVLLAIELNNSGLL